MSNFSGDTKKMESALTLISPVLEMVSIFHIYWFWKTFCDFVIHVLEYNGATCMCTVKLLMEDAKFGSYPQMHAQVIDIYFGEICSDNCYMYSGFFYSRLF